MKDTAEDLREVVEYVGPLLRGMNDDQSMTPRAPGKWMPKQILGHLIDSAANNHQKFIRLIGTQKMEFVGYGADHWVDAQHYNASSWSELIALWSQYNLHLAHVIERIPISAHQHEIVIDGVGPFTLEFIVPDYVEHLKHHLLQINAEWQLNSSFANVYGVVPKS